MRYVGGEKRRWRVSDDHQHIPKHEIYVEAFAGSAAIFRHKKPARLSYLVERCDTQASNLAILDAHLICKNALDVLPMSWTWTGNVFVYLDPPYHPSARRDLDLYTHELTISDHDELLNSLLPRMTAEAVQWALSGYRCAAYDDAAARHGWHRVDYQAMTRRGVVTESLWMNYDPATIILHDYQYWGASFRERERIRRKIDRWTNRLSALPHHERHALLASIAASDRTSP